MKFLRKLLDDVHPLFDKGGKLHKFFGLYEVFDTLAYTPGKVTQGSCHVRDAMDLKRMMTTVIVALGPCVFMAMYNTGLQANEALASLGLSSTTGWRASLIALLGSGYDPSSCWANIVHGALYFIPVYIVCNLAGGFWEILFALVRKHEVNEGFFVTGMLFPLILPPTIPLWQVAIGISFGVVIGKEVFGGTGRNILNPALTARAFLFFAYPAAISGDAVWVAVDGFASATPLGVLATDGMSGVMNSVTWAEAFYGFIPGSMGETSTLACLFGAAVLVLTGVGSWRIMVGMFVGTMALSLLFHTIGSTTNPAFEMPAEWHLVVGGFAFGLVFMATDPVSAAMTETGKWVYGLLIGVMVTLVRVVNPAFPEGTMLAILFGNTFSPLIDYYVVRVNIKKRSALRHA